MAPFTRTRPSSPPVINFHNPPHAGLIGAIELTGKATAGWNAVDNAWNGIEDLYLQVDGGAHIDADWRRGIGDPVGQVTWTAAVTVCLAGDHTVEATITSDFGSRAHSRIVIEVSVNASVGPNVRVTVDTNPANDRSESSLAADPNKAAHMVGASKKFWSPPDYGFTLAAYTTVDGGDTWFEAPALTLLGDWGGITDPTVAFDMQGNAYLVALAFQPNPPPNDVGPIIGLYVYSSADGIKWNGPKVLYQGYADKQDAAGDHGSRSPYKGNVYVAWDPECGFARTNDSGKTWLGVGNKPVGSPLGGATSSPEIAVGNDGTVYIVWLAGEASPNIMFVKSTDGGKSFTTPAAVGTGIKTLQNSVPPLVAPNGFAELPGGTFRVETFPTVCAGRGGAVVVAWADYRDGVSRVYYRQSSDSGKTWSGPTSGQPLLVGANIPASTLHDFHPQLASDPSGLIGCAFYEFGPMPVLNLINVIAVFSDNNGLSFPSVRTTVTDRPWDPTIDAPLSHGYPQTTFIGDYFGLAASDLGFFPFWTDTRTGIQEIFTARIAIKPCHGGPIYAKGRVDRGPAAKRNRRRNAPDSTGQSIKTVRRR